MPKNLQTALLISLLLGAGLFGYSLWAGKENAFLWLNTDLGNFADQFFRYWTYAGDGMVWVPVTILILIARRKYWILAFSSIIISTLIAQLSKNIFFKGLPRPSLAITDHSIIHTVPGVELHTMNSFPSGHTTTAFTLFFLACFFINKKWMLYTGLVYALLAAYSRVYLAQHFPIDLSGGILAASITIFLSVYLQNKWGKIDSNIISH